MTHPPFNWTSPAGIADGQELCEWCGLILWAQPGGGWRVVRWGGDTSKPGEILVSHDRQRPGVDLDEAKQLAQAAAMQLIQ